MNLPKPLRPPSCQTLEKNGITFLRTSSSQIKLAIVPAPPPPLSTFNLPTLNSSPSGFRLQTVEIYNWGTFDQHVWRLEPGGENSLLTGANGSGKTTLVDAILTLLVPSNLRFYNQSSGAESKRERSEESYTLGAYSTRQSESGLSASTTYLRQKENAYSILIACFFNEHSGEHLSLAQVRWFANQSLKRAYFVASQPLDIASHFTPMDPAGNWKRRLKRETQTQEYDSFTKYTQAFSQVLGLKSDKALSLFAQTVGIKVLGNLNDFIRTHMLEEIDSEEAFVKLRGHYDNLLQSYQAIERARQQLALLQPIMDHRAAHAQAQREFEQLQAQEEALAPFFAQKKATLYAEAIHGLEIDRKRKDHQINELRQQLKTLSEQRTQLQIAIRSDEVSAQLEQLGRSIEQAEKDLRQRQKQAERYDGLAEALDLPSSPKEKQFYRSLEQCGQQLAALAEALEANQADLTRLAVEQSHLQRDQDEQQELLASLQQRQNRLPLEQVRIRKRLAESLGISEKQLPFAAELMQVREEAKAEWATPLEQLLRPLGLSVLVSEEQHDAAVASLHRLKLEGHLRLIHVQDTLMNPMPGRNSILEFIDLKPSHPLREWLWGYLCQHFRHVRLSGFGQMARYQQAINEKGLRKDHGVYERDDHPKRWQESLHILGWDNLETIRLVQRQLQELEEELGTLNQNLKQRQQKARDLQRQREGYLRLKEFEVFADIDVKSVEKHIKSLQKEREALLKSSDHLRDLQHRLDEVNEDITRAEDKRDRQIEQRGRLDSRLENYREEHRQAEDQLAQATDEWQAHQTAIEALLLGEELKVSTVSRTENMLRRAIGQEREVKGREASKYERHLLLAMQQFINPSPEILEAHPNWTAETLDLRAELGYLPEFERIFRRIKEEELPRYRARFKEWLNERLIYDIASFKTALDNRETKIEESIETINSSLRGIRFNDNPETFIQLTHAKTRDMAIRDFKQMLREAMPDLGKLAQGDEAELEACFLRIRRIIEELSANENWRRKVTDVRNWLEFAASERYRADEQERQYYEDSQSLSGGEKAKLAYTILASAIAYQFGIRSEGQQRRSFRFAVVDEAFSKVDPANAIYAMELFKQLDLQLMVVTPLDKINLAEPYIHTVHYVQNREKRNSEVFDVGVEVVRKGEWA